MVGRDAPLAAADAALSAALSGSGGLLLISGEPGIGKTLMAQSLADRASGRSVPHLWGFAVDDHGAPPLWPWRRALRGFPGVAMLLDAEVPAAGRADPSARFQLFTDVCDQLVLGAEQDGLLLVLEDVHWADPVSLSLLEQLVNELPRSRVLVVATYRPGVHGPLDAVLGRLVRGSSVTPLSLTGLTPADIDTWLRRDITVTKAVSDATNNTDTTALAADVCERTGGNPLLVRLITQALGDGTSESVPRRLESVLAERPDVRRLIASRASGLSGPARRVVDAASVLGERCSRVLLMMLLEDPQAETSEAAAEAVDAGILRETPSEAGTLEFTHALVRDAIYAELPPADRARWHRRCATVLEKGDTAAPAGIVAGHWRRADGPDAVARCRAAAEAAAAEATATFAYDDACRFRELAVRCATELHAPDGDVAELTVRLAESLFAAGNVDATLTACADASDAAARARRPDVMVEAGLVVQGIGTPDVNRRVRQLCERALAAVGDGAAGDRASGDGPLGDEAVVWRARLLAQIAAATAEDEGGPLAERLSAEALSAAEETGDPTAILEAIAARHLAISVPDMVAQRLDLGRRAVQLGAVAARPMAALWGHLWRVDAAYQLGNLDEVDREIADIDRIATDRRSPLARWHWHRLLATRTALLGNFAAARRHNGDASALAGRMGDLSLAGMSYAFSAELAIVRGDPSEVPEDFQETLERMPRMPLVLISGTIISALAGDLSAARASFESLRDLPRSFPYGTKWAATLAQIGIAAILLDDTEVADVVYTALAPTALYYTGDGSGALYNFGANAAVVGEFALTAGRVDDAVRLLHDGIAMNARIGARPAAARARLALAQALLLRSAGTARRTQRRTRQGP